MRTFSNHLQSGKTGIQTHILDVKCCVHSTRPAVLLGARQNVKNPGGKATGRWKGRNDHPPEVTASFMAEVSPGGQEGLCLTEVRE